MRKYLILLSFVLSLTVLPMLISGCSSDAEKPALDPDGNPVEATVESAEVLFQQAQAAMQEKKYREAISKYQEVERLHPYSVWATKAQLMAASAAFEENSYDEAILALDRFIELHPGHEEVDYAYYMKAIAYYEQISDVARDQEMTKNAMESLETLITRFPNSQYARDARLKRDLTLDHLAGKEMEIGRYYLNRNQINAAINRFRTVVTEYQTTTHTPEALHRLVEAYLTLGLKTEATRVAAVLGHNYPGSKWYEDSYKILDQESRQQIIEERSFLDKTVDSLFKPD